jgi:thiol protease/hemagglutinin prtT
MEKYSFNRWLLLLIGLGATLASWAEPRNRRQAQQIAAQYVGNPQLQASASVPQTRAANTPPPYYLFTDTAKTSFVIVSGESRLNEVVGYGNIHPGAKTETPLPDYLKSLLQRYEMVVQAVRSGKANVPQVQLPKQREVKPLLTCQWDQRLPFNLYTPLSNGVHTPTGCVATATAQVMYHHRWPKQRPSLYVASQGSAAQKSSDYLWTYMKDKGSAMNVAGSEAVSVLMSDVGRAVRMRYFYRGSDSNLQYAMEALRNNFGYSVRKFSKDLFPAGIFHEMLLKELADGYPVLASGGSHVFVFDGYDRQGFVHANWGWSGEHDGYFDINTIYLPVSGFALNDGKFYEEIEVVFAHPKDGKHTAFAEHRQLETRAVCPFTIAEKEAPRSAVLHATIRKVGTDNPVNGSLGRFTGRAGLAVYNESGVQVRFFESISTHVNISSIFTTTTLEFENLDFSGLPNGIYTLQPISNELIESPSSFSGWQPIAYANTKTVTLTTDKVLVSDDDSQNAFLSAQNPELLAPLYQGSGRAAVFQLTINNPGWKEIRGKMVVRFRGIDHATEYTAPVLQDVLAQQLGSTTVRIPVLTSYSSTAGNHALTAGRYQVTFAILQEGTEKKEVPIKTTAPVEVIVLSEDVPFYLSITNVDFLSDGKATPWQVFSPKETRNIGLMATATLRGRSSYYGPLFYRLKDLADGTSIEAGSVSHVSFIAFAYNQPRKTLVQFPITRLKPGHTYEVHVEIEQNGQRTDIWNNENARVYLAVEAENTATGIAPIASEANREAVIYNLQGVRIHQSVDQLPHGIYLINGKKIQK